MKHHRIVTRLIVVLAMLAAPGHAGAAAPGNLGTNVAAVTYYGGVVIFNDLVRQSGDWVSQQEGRPWGAGSALSLRADGWPRSLEAGQSATLPLADVAYPAGTYRVRWTGSGTFSIAGRSFNGADGRGVVTLDGSSFVALTISATSAVSPLRAIRVLVPGADSRQLFRAAWVRSLAPYGTLRFMDWQRTNGTSDDPVPRQTCATRVRPGDVSQGTRRGASVEVMVMLANQRRANPWFTIPHNASSDWIRCHARMVAARLRPGLVPRYEFSNETWNPAFIQYHDLEAAGVRRGLGGGDSYLALQQEVALRHAGAMRIVSAEFHARSRRVIRVLSGQAANDWVLEQRLSHAGAAAATDQIAIAPYVGLAGANPFDPAEAAQIAAHDRSWVFATMRTAIDDEVAPWITAHRELSRRFRRPLIAYEGGQHLAGDPDNDQLTALLTGANTDARMGALYDTYLQRWRSLTGNQLFVHFTDAGPASRYGSWGARLTPTTPVSASPKYQALLRYRVSG